MFGSYVRYAFLCCARGGDLGEGCCLESYGVMPGLRLWVRKCWSAGGVDGGGSI